MMNLQQVSKKYIRFTAKCVMILMLLLLVGCNARSGREQGQVGQAESPTAVQGEEAVGTILPASPAAGNHSAYEDSISFAHLLSQPAAHNRRVAYTEFFGSNKQTDNHGWTIRDERFKLIKLENGKRLFYDLLADPAEQTNLLPNGMDEVATQHLAELEAQASQLREGE